MTSAEADGGHLTGAAREALRLSDDERIEKIRAPRWVGYTQAKAVLSKLEDLLQHPKTHRMPNMLIVGDTNNGKTMIVNRFAQLHPAHDNPGGGSITVPVLVVQAPPVPDEGRLYSRILDLLYAPYRSHDQVSAKQLQVMKLLRFVNLRMLVIDEVHHVLAGGAHKQRQFLNVLKYLGNELQIPIVGVGTKEAVRAVQSDGQLANRFQPVALPRWEMKRDFLMLLASFEAMLPLRRASQLAEAALASRILAMSEGTIGETAALLTAAATYAVRVGHERIDAGMLAAIDWIPPSERKRAAEGLR